MSLENIDWDQFWNDNDYSLKHYRMECPSDEDIQEIEKELHYKLPQSYIDLMKKHNGGLVKKNCFSMKEAETWSPEHILITGIIGIGREKTYSLCGTLGTRFMIEQWGYPDIGICICDTPSDGQEMIMLDYRECGKDGEPQVVYIDKLFDYKITFMAKNFESFIQGLVSEVIYEDEMEDEIDEEGWIEERFND